MHLNHYQLLASGLDSKTAAALPDTAAFKRHVASHGDGDDDDDVFYLFLQKHPGRFAHCLPSPRRAVRLHIAHIISVSPSKQPLMVRTFLKVYMELGAYA